MISTFCALCNGGCCGSLRQQVPTMTLIEGVILEKNESQHGFQKCFCSASHEDEYTKVFFHQVNTCDGGRYDRVGSGPCKGDESLGTGSKTLIYCLRTKTTDKTLNLRSSETLAKEETGAAT